MSYSPFQYLHSKKIFLINRSELEGRLEVQYYLPEINQLEKTIRKKSNKKLRDFIIKMSSGATPSVQEKEKFYGDEVSGIPFLRVQNLNSNSRLDLSNVKYINKETHENYLKRSQVLEGDLLVKITGVGRMAIASVAPDGFVGNTNQHMVVIKTEKKEVSNYLANYLNLDIVEKLASRRATGATRPALDYPALKSIPVIENIDFSVLGKAEQLMQQKEAEAKALLESIDSYLLFELGIRLTEKDNSLKKRIFTLRFSEVAGERLDSIFYASDLMRFYSGKYASVSLKSVSISFKSGIGAGKQDQAFNQNGIIQIRPTNIDENGLLKFDRNIYLPFEVKADTLDVDDVLFNNTNSQELVGKTSIVKEQKELCYSNHITRIKVDRNKLVPDFLWVILNLYQKNRVFYSICTNWNNQSGIGLELLKSLKIPLPPLEKQTEIANHIHGIYSQAKALHHEAMSVLEEAKREVEKMILEE